MQARRGEAGATAELARLQASAEHLHFITRTFAALQLHERHAVCDTLLNMTATFLEADAGAVVLLDKEEPTVVVRGGLQVSALLSSQAQSLWRSVTAGRRSRSVSHEHLRDLWPEAPIAFGDGLLAAPIDVHDRSIGLMVLPRRESTGVREDLAFITSVCGVGALAIGSADAILVQHGLVRASQANAAAAESFAARVTSRMQELSRGQCSLTELSVERERDPRARVVFAGLLKVYSDWRDQAQRREDAEIETRAREARYRALFDLAKVCIWDCDLTQVVAELKSFGSGLDGHFASDPNRVREIAKHLRVRAVNRQTLELFAVPSAETLLQELPNIIVDESLPMFWQLWSALARGERKIELSGILRGRGDALKHVVFGVTVPDEHGLTHAIVTVSDITPIHEARHAAEELASVRAKEIDRINEEVERLFHAVSHDLRSPLRGIINLVEFADEDLALGHKDEVGGHLGLIRTRAERLDEMLDDLLSYAKAGRIGFALETVDIGDLMREIVDMLIDVPPGFDIHWTDLPKVETQRPLLSQVLLNLVDNAIKHHHGAPGVIHVTSVDVGHAVELRVMDDGPGIPAEFREKVFAMFSTLRRRDEVEGSGMGLALVKKVVLAMGGDVAIEPNAPRGSIVVVTWPKSTGPTDADR